jgi:hypothetical protein
LGALKEKKMHLQKSVNVLGKSFNKVGLIAGFKP